MLTISGLTVRFGGLLAVDDLTLSVAEGTVVGLIGPNGAGKSTAINAISGFVKPASGSIRLRDTELLKLKPHQRARKGLGRTFQNLELFGSMTVLDNVVAQIETMESVSRTERIERTMTVLRSVGLERIADRVVSHLSYPERKLVELARAIAANADVVLLDEPAAGLSAEEKPRFVNIITNLIAERKMTALIVEHDMEVVRNLCSYVYVMDSGKIVASGTFDSVMADATVQRAYLGIG
jgi:ABC-type branched-subunit amino acid transport system ATPase component